MSSNLSPLPAKISCDKVIRYVKAVRMGLVYPVFAARAGKEVARVTGKRSRIAEKVARVAGKRSRVVEKVARVTGIRSRVYTETLSRDTDSENHYTGRI